MHIPDGFLSAPVVVATNAAAAVAVGAALKGLGEEMDDRRIPLMGITAAFVFGAQMLNFPILGGTSGHILGGLMTAILVGPKAAVIVMTIVLVVQAFLFNDGGVLALGANIVNMAIIGSWCCYWIYRRLEKFGTLGLAVSAWLSVVLGAAACALELAFSGTVPLLVVLPTMVTFHAIIGIGEALVTVSAVAFVKRLKPEIFYR